MEKMTIVVPKGHPFYIEEVSAKDGFCSIAWNDALERNTILIEFLEGIEFNASDPAILALAKECRQKLKE